MPFWRLYDIQTMDVDVDALCQNRLQFAPSFDLPNFADPFTSPSKCLKRGMRTQIQKTLSMTATCLRVTGVEVQHQALNTTHITAAHTHAHKLRKTIENSIYQYIHCSHKAVIYQ